MGAGNPGMAGADRGDFQQAVALAQGAQLAAPHASSAHFQAVAQEGRAWARAGDAAETRRALARLEALVSPLPVPDRPEHHYRYDPPKSQAYVATTLAWVGDAAAEGITREVLARNRSPGRAPARPRRAALARLDLALVLTASGKDDEAAAMALQAVRSGRLAPSMPPRPGHHPGRAASQAPGVRELAEAHHDWRPRRPHYPDAGRAPGSGSRGHAPRLHDYPGGTRGQLEGVDLDACGDIEMSTL